MGPSHRIEVAIVRKLPSVGSLHFSTRLRAHRKICGNRLPQLAPRLPRCKKRSLAPESIGSDPYSLGAVLFVGRLPCQSASHEDRDIGLGGGARLGTIGIAANSTASCWPRLRNQRERVRSKHSARSRYEAFSVHIESACYFRQSFQDARNNR